MNRRTKTLVLLLAALAVLSGGYFALTALTEEEPAAATPPLLSVDAEKLTALSWTYGGETVSLVRGADGWADAEDGAFPLDAAQVDTMAGVLQNMTATAAIEAPADLAEYGLDAPACTIRFTADGTETALALGDYNSLISAYYLQTSDGVYAVSSALYTAFTKTLCDLAVRETLPASDGVTAVAVNVGGAEYRFARTPGGRAEVYTAALEWFADGSAARPLDPDAVESYLTELDVVWSACVAWNADDAALEGYGLGAAASSVTAEYDGGDSLVLLLGASCDEGVYARLAGSRMVYTVAAADADALLAPSDALLAPKTLLTLDWDEVDAVELTGGGQTATLIKNDEGGWLCRGVTLDSTQAASLQSALTGLARTTPETAAIPEDAPALTGTVYQNRDGFEELTLALTPAGDCWLASLGGAEPVPVTADSAQALLTALTDAVAATSAGAAE